jgi:hypothetical protein
VGSRFIDTRLSNSHQVWRSANESNKQNRESITVHNEAIDRALHEVQAARRDLTITGFCMRQAEAIRRLDRARANLADLVQSGSRKNKHSPTCVSQGPL